jgi:hypothetical protein
VDRATCPKRIIRVATRVVRGNKTIRERMRDKTRAAQKRGCRSWKINSTNWKRTIKNLRQNLRHQRNQTVSLQKEIFGMQMVRQLRKQTWQIRLWNFARIFCFLVTRVLEGWMEELQTREQKELLLFCREEYGELIQKYENCYDGFDV